MAGMDHVKKITQKDRYGNQVSYEFENPIKPIDQTELMKKMMDDMGPVHEMEIEVPDYDHPGEPKGTDTVPAWLTPGEFVVNKEATEIYGDEIKAMNDHGREIQAKKGMEVPGYQTGGDVPFIAGPMLTDPKFMQDGGWVTEALLDRLAEVESGGNNKAVSPAGAVGKYQWLPSSAKQAGYGVKSFDPLNEKAARKATAQYLKNMQKYHGFTPEETLRAYNWGPGNVINYNKGKRKDIPAEALNYPGKILGVENIEGVPVHGEMPLPTPRPTGRPEGGTNQDTLKAFLDKYLASGGIVNYLQPGGYPNPNVDPVPQYYDDAVIREANKPEPINYRDIAQSIELGGEEDVDLPSNVVPELQDVPGNPMYEGETTSDTPWWHGLLGHRSKEALNIPLSENEKRLADQATADEERISGELAEEENMIASDPIVQDIESDIVGESGTTDNIDGAGQVDDYDPKFKKEVKEETIKKIDEETKDAKSVEEDDKTIEKKANENPGEIAKAEGFLKGILGDLIRY